MGGVARRIPKTPFAVRPYILSEYSKAPDLLGYAAHHQQALVLSFPCGCQGLHVPDEAAKSASARCACRHYECYADEHYVPTLLAYKGLEEHTDCLGYTTSVDW